MPTPAVADTISSIGVYNSALMVLEKVWRDPLGAISANSLAAGGVRVVRRVSWRVDQAGEAQVCVASDDDGVSDSAVGAG